MDTKQELNIIDKHFNTLEVLGVNDKEEFIALVYLMFIDEYYETFRNISFNNPDAEDGLTDCKVKLLNECLDYLKRKFNLFNHTTLTELHSMSYWVIPDAPKYYDVVLNGDNCSLSGAGNYKENSIVTISSTPVEGYRFVDWSDEITDNPREITVTEDITLTANIARRSYIQNSTLHVDIGIEENVAKVSGTIKSNKLVL